MTDPARLLDTLASLSHEGGGWSYAPGQEPHLEPTCLALLALAGSPRGDQSPFASLIAAGKTWLETCAVGDGTYRLSRGRREAAWPTALVLFTRAELGDKDLDPLGQALLTLRGRALDTKSEDDINDVDGMIIGWSWAEGTFSWVEPTSWACLALRRLGQGAQSRVVEGGRLLLDRVLPDGGVNYGNRRILGIPLEPIPTPSALMLLALQGNSEDERILKTLDYLGRTARESSDVEHLSWATLALDVYRDPTKPSQLIEELQERIRRSLVEREETSYVQPAPVRLALAALALDCGRRNPFRLSGVPIRPALQPGKLIAPGKGIGGRIKSFFRGLAANTLAQLRPLEPQSPVHIAPVTDYNANLVDVVCRQYELFRDKVPLAGKRVVLKPNLVEYHRNKVINTNPNVVAAVIELCQREKAAEVIVAEGPGHWRNVEYLVAASGLGDVLRHYKVPFVDLNHDEPIRCPNYGRLTRLDHLYLARTITTADVVISLPKLKTHHWAVATLSLKNLFGTVPGICYGWPKNELHWRGIDNSIVDIAMTRTPDLAIVDGIIGMEGDGPLNGTPRAAGVIVMGADLLAVDATCCRLMQLDPTKIAYLVMGHQKKLGQLAEASIVQRGETILQRRQPFETLPPFKPVWLDRGV